MWDSILSVIIGIYDNVILFFTDCFNVFFNFIVEIFTDAINYWSPFFQSFADGFSSLLTWLGSGVFSVISFPAKVLIDIFYFFFDNFLSLTSSAITSIQVPQSYFDWYSADGHILYVLVQSGFFELLALIGAAFLVRLLLNLIPSWATRV